MSNKKISKKKLNDAWRKYHGRDIKNKAEKKGAEILLRQSEVDMEISNLKPKKRTKGGGNK